MKIASSVSSPAVPQSLYLQKRQQQQQRRLVSRFVFFACLGVVALLEEKDEDQALGRVLVALFWYLETRDLGHACVVWDDDAVQSKPEEATVVDMPQRKLSV